MSLISDALQKAGGPASTGSGPVQEKPKRSFSRGILFVIAVGLIFLGLAQFNNTSNEPAVTQRKSLASTNQRSPFNLRSGASAWRLSGIIESNESPSLALIDGELVAEGGLIRGARLVRIDSDQVDLEQEGKVETLTLR